MTLLRWVDAGRLPKPRHVDIGGRRLWLWSRVDVERAKKFKGANYRKATRPGRGLWLRKKSSKKG